MPKYRVELTEDAFNWLTNAVGQAATRLTKGESRLMGMSEVIAQLQESLSEAVKVNEKRSEPAAPTHVVHCSKHPTYGAQRVPGRDCKTCWAAYKKFHPLDYDTKRRQFERKLKTK